MPKRVNKLVRFLVLLNFKSMINISNFVATKILMLQLMKRLFIVHTLMPKYGAAARSNEKKTGPP